MRFNKNTRSFAGFFLSGIFLLVLPLIAPGNKIVSQFSNVFFFVGLSYFFTSFSFLFNDLNLAKREKVSNQVLILGISVALTGLILKSLSLIGGNFFIVIGTAFVAFTYSTILSTIRKEKWAGYAQKKWQILLMRFGDISGIGLLLSGILGKYLNWSFSNIFLVIGAVILTSSLLVWNKLFSSEVILRKQAEADLRKTFEKLHEQHKVIEEKNKEILDSIHYASRIQRALITSEKYIAKKLSEIDKGY